MSAAGSLRQQERARRDGRGLHDGGGRLAECQKRVEHALDLVNGGDVHLEEKAVLAGDAMALDGPRGP